MLFGPECFLGENNEFFFGEEEKFGIIRAIKGLVVECN
jgi:hypothetical protein